MAFDHNRHVRNQCRQLYQSVQNYSRTSEPKLSRPAWPPKPEPVLHAIKAGLSLIETRPATPRVGIDNGLDASPGHEPQTVPPVASEVFEVAGDHSACVSRADLFIPVLIAACRSVERRVADI